MTFESFSWIKRIVLKQERFMRKEYTEQYVTRCLGDGINPLPYAAWRQQRNEPKLLEFLIEENRLNHTTDDQDPLNTYFSDRISVFAGITEAPTLPVV